MCLFLVYFITHEVGDICVIAYILFFSAQLNHCVADLTVPVLLLAMLGLLHASLKR